MDRTVFEGQAIGNPFGALVGLQAPRTPPAIRGTVVRDGVPQATADAAVLAAKAERRRANARARYQRLKDDPVQQERRRAWQARHKEARLAAQRAVRATPEGLEAHRKAQRDYYERNRERILARERARREAHKVLPSAGQGGAA